MKTVIPAGRRGKSTLRWERGNCFAHRLAPLLVVVFVGFILFGKPQCASAQVTADTPVFGPQTYTRTTGAPNEYTTTFAVPAWIVSPYNLHIVNGDSKGNNRISSAAITLNGAQVAGPSDFNQNVATIDRQVSLTAQTTLQVTLASNPGSYLIISFLGQNADHTPPKIAFATPTNGSAINTATPYLDITYSDAVGSGEPAASGVNTNSLKVTLDGTDQTSLFTIRSGDASATLPQTLPLAQGAHTLSATVSDFAGNTSTATSQFTVDLTPPQIQVAQPAKDSYLNTTAPAISVQYSDADGVNLSSLKILVNGTDLTPLFTKTSSGASVTLPAASALPQGANKIVAQIQDLAGNQASTSVAFNVDTTPPRISFAHPLAGAYDGTSTVTVTVQYSDDQAIDLTTLQVTLDGTPVAMTPASTTATGTANGASNGSHTLTVNIRDKAGNPATATIAFTVDTTAPAINVVQPAPGALLNTASPSITINYSDIENDIDTSTLQIQIDGTDRTALFSAGPSSATAQLAGQLALPQGTNSITASIKNLAENQGTTTTTFTVDTIPPLITIQAPPAQTNSNAPTVTISYSDATSGVDPASVHVLLDGADVTKLIAASANSATGVLQMNPPLADGTHQLQVTLADRAGNPAQASLSFVVDTTPPAVSFASPANNSFLNNLTPSLVLNYSDLGGTGVDTSSPKITLQQGNTNPPADITAEFQIGAQQATGAIPTSASLADGTYTLTAVVSDNVGNLGTAQSRFEIDTVPPTGSIQLPAVNAILNTAIPSVIVNYQDERSGIDASKLVLTLDGSDQTSVLTLGLNQATGILPPVLDGAHTIHLTVFDRAGNSSGAISQTFIIDTIPPTIAVSTAPAPNAAGWNNTDVTVTFTCSDVDSGVTTCPAPIAVATEGTNQQFCGQAIDAAGNSSAPVCASLNIDKTPPTITAALSPTPNANGWNTTPVTVTFTCADSLSGVANCPAPVTVSTAGINQTISGTATDIAGNPFTASVVVNLAMIKPTITAAVSPPPSANGWNNSPVTITFTCAQGTAPITACPAPQVVSTQGANQQITGTVTDAAALTGTTTVSVSLDSTPPTIAATPTPSPNANSWYSTNVTVSFTCADALSGVAVCPAPVTVSTEGANQVVSGIAIDDAGNTAAANLSLNIEKTLPTITATASPTPNAAGWNNTNVTVTFTCTHSISAISNCPPPQTVSTEGAGQVVSGTVQDQAGNQATASVALSIDRTPPSILQFSSPSQLALGQSGTATLSVSDNVGVISVVFQLNGATIATLLAPSYTVTIDVPASAKAGDTLVLTAIVSDAAGNINTANRGVQVVAAGVVVGQVLMDATGLPFPGATVQVLGGNAHDTSDDTGRYSIPSNSSDLFLSISAAANSSTGAPATTTVEREVNLQNGVGTVPVDVRLTPIAAAIPINISGGSLFNGSITVSIPAGGVSSMTNFHLTTLSQQGLPGLLLLGWSPVAAFDLRADSATSATFNANFTQLPNSLTVHLVRYDFNSHTWLLVTPNLGVVNGALTIPIPSVGDFALVTLDAANTSLSVPSVGQALAGVSMVLLPASATATGSLNPPSVSPTGGTSAATLSVQSSVPLPSGTVIQARVQDTYSLVSGKQLSAAPRLEDILLYQFSAPVGAAAAATFPVTPSQTFQPGQLSSGVVHLDILSGRESVRGQVGGSDAASVTGGDATLSVTAGSLPEDTAISIAPEGIDTFLPSMPTLVPLAEYNVDFSGEILNVPAQLSVAAGAAQPGDSILVAQIQRVNGVPYLVVVSLAQVNGGTLVTQSAPGLSGITQGGDYVFYKLLSPTGYVSGTVTASSGPVAAIVQTDSLPFVSFSNFSGSYVIPAVPGAVHLTASVPNTALAGAATTQVTTGQTATANLTVVGQVESATVTPPNGAVGIPLTAEIDITAPDAFNQTSVTASSVTLTQNSQGANTPVPVRFVFSPGDTRLAVFPLSALQPSTTYTLAASGLANGLGGLIAVPTITFTTQAITPPNFNTDALVFSMPDQNGNVTVSAPANSFPSGTTILIVDQTNGVVLSLTVGNDGSVSGQFPATIDDVLAVTITAPDKTTSTFTRSQFVAPDGTTAVGPGGGTVTGPGGTGIIIPQGALNKGTTFKLTPLDQTAFSVLPNWQGLNFGAGLRIEAPEMPAFSKEVKLAFPVPPNAPKDAFYYVFRRITDNNGNTFFETIDHAFVQGSGAGAQVVTASPPFCGYRNSYGNFNTVAAASFPAIIAVNATPFGDFVYMWDITQTDPNQPGIASPGLIVGRALQAVRPTAAQPATTYVPVQGATIQLTDAATNVAVTSDSCGTFTIFDPQLGGGTRNLTASYNGQTIQTVAQEVNGVQVDDATYAITAGLENQYRNIGRTTITFAPATPPAPPPQINIGIYTLDSNNNRQPISGIVQTGTTLTVTFSSTLSVVGATINGAPISTVVPDSVRNPVAGFNYTRLSDAYQPDTPGVFTLVASALDPLNPTNPPLTLSRSFLVIQTGGAVVPTDNVPPTVVGATPQNNALNVPTTAFPVITFSEPVTNVPGNVTLVGSRSGDSPSLLLIGIKSDGTVANPVQPADAVTSLTIQALTGLQFGETYMLTLRSGILGVGKDQQTGNPIALAPYTLQFTTFGPQQLGGAQSQYTVITRPVVIDKRAYAGELLNSVITGLGIFNIINPASPVDMGASVSFIGRGTDAAGQAQSPVTGGPLVALSATFAQDNFIPSNIWLYDVSNPDAPSRVGAVSATTSATQAGTVLRMAMKDQFLYTSTSQQGLQVIDLQAAVTEYQQVFTSNPAQFGQSITTEGQGFATDTVVNTIQLPAATGGTFTMFDVKADDFVTAGGGSVAATQTLLVATGQLPLVMADPTLAGSSAVLYPPTANGGLSKQPLQMTSTNGAAAYQMCSGRAVAMGTIPVMKNGVTTNLHIVVVVGTGLVGSPGSINCSATPAGVPLLAVVDVSQTYTQGSGFTPKPIGFMQLSAGATDVKLNGTVALVATGTNVLLVNVANPYLPTSAGQVTGTFGNWISLTNDGILVGSSPNAANGSIQTAVFKPVVIIPSQTVLAKLVSGDPTGKTSTPVFQLAQDVTLTAQVVPANPNVQQGSVTITTGNSTFQPKLNFNGTSVATAVIPANTRVTGTSFQATGAASDPQVGPIQGFPSSSSVGTVQLVMDFNNDSQIDETTDTPALKNANKVAFWASDSTVTGLPPRERLLDYLTVRVKSSVPWQAGTIQLQLQSNFADDWFLADKLKPDNSYLQNDADSILQDNLVGQSCQFSATHPQSLGGECFKIAVQNASQPSDYNPQPLPNLQLGNTDFLFRCEQCPQHQPNVSAAADRTLQLVSRNADGSLTVLDEAKLDIRLVREWMSIYDVRSTDLPTTEDDYRPRSYPTGANFEAQLKQNWAQVPNDADNITVLVHGFHTDVQSAEQKFIPIFFKRLYWAGHPVLDTNQIDTQGHAHVVGIEWPGDEQFSELTSPGLLFFPEDEEHALEAGVPLAQFVTNLEAGGAAGRVVNVIAHSLGNMVVNSALMRMPPNTINKYVMYDAAVPAEAFGAGFAPDPYLLAHAQELGYPGSNAPIDNRWQTDWTALLKGDDLPAQTDLANWCSLIMATTNYTALKPRYELRWGQLRPAAGVLDEMLPVAPSPPPCNVATDQPQRGPWQGFFSENVKKTNILNAYNAHDLILEFPWRIMQTQQKPNDSPKLIQLGQTLINLTTNLAINGAQAASGQIPILWPPNFQLIHADDTRPQPFWAQLKFTSPAEKAVFNGAPSSNIVRQWAELSQWFPSTTPAIGNVSASTAVGIPDIPLSAFGQSGFTTTHTFLYELPLPEVLPALRAIHVGLMP